MAESAAPFLSESGSLETSLFRSRLLTQGTEMAAEASFF